MEIAYKYAEKDLVMEALLSQALRRFFSLSPEDHEAELWKFYGTSNLPTNDNPKHAALFADTAYEENLIRVQQSADFVKSFGLNTFKEWRILWTNN